jgi:hypothetical protein
MKITKTQTVDGRKYYLVTGITGKTLMDDIAKKYSKNYQLTAFPMMHLKKGKLLLLKRTNPLKNSINKFYTWETGKGK